MQRKNIWRVSSILHHGTSHIKRNHLTFSGPYYFSFPKTFGITTILSYLFSLNLQQSKFQLHFISSLINLNHFCNKLSTITNLHRFFINLHLQRLTFTINIIMFTQYPSSLSNHHHHHNCFKTSSSMDSWRNLHYHQTRRIISDSWIFSELVINNFKDPHIKRSWENFHKISNQELLGK